MGVARVDHRCMTSDYFATSVSGPAALITAIPALLGFIPERSLVLITFEGDGDEIGTTMRHDLTLQRGGAPTATMLGVIDHLARVCESYSADRVIAVIVDDTRDLDDPAYRRLAAILDRKLSGLGGLHGAFATSAIAAGKPWVTLWDSRIEELAPDLDTGLVGDPMISPVAIARAVGRGRRVLMTRGEMIDNLSPLPHCSADTCGAHEISADDDRAYGELARATDEDEDHDRHRGDDDDEEGVAAADVSGSIDQTTISSAVLAQFARRLPGETTSAQEMSGRSPSERVPLHVLVDHLRRAQERADLEFVLAIVDRAAQPLSCDDLQRLDKALRELYVRDALVSLAVTDLWTRAEQLWTQAARRLRGRGQAAAATLLGFVHYVHGNGAMAGIAFDVALDASPGYSMAMLYNDALVRGIPPRVINQCAETGYVVARSLGVELPPPVLRPAA